MITGQRPNKIFLEIGFGNGEYTAALAASDPGALVFGLEVSLSCATRCARRVERAGLSNVKILCADARFMMKELFADESLDMVIMNFPCPWPKNRHAKRRVTAKEFADGLAAVLKTGGAFEMVTDEEWYAAEVAKTLSKHEALSARECLSGFTHARAEATKYERKWTEMGKNITKLTVVKTKSFTTARQTWEFYKEGDADMHVKTGAPMPGPGGLAFLEGTSGVRGAARWAFNKYYTSRAGVFLVETITTDDDFEQRCYLKIVERDGGAMVKLDAAAKVFLTPAVRFAVEDLARRLTEAP